MNFFRRLQNRVIIFDGAMGTMLQSSGIKPGECPEYWNLLYPDLISAIHRAYLNAGADIIQTNTFGANRLKLREFKLEHKLEDIVGAAVNNAKKAARDRGMIALSLGPTGKLMEPYGDLSFEEAYNVFKELINCGAKNGIDLISIETMIDIQEAKAALLAAKQNTNLPVICQMTFKTNGRTETGTDFLTGATILQSLGADVVGANCALGPEELLKIIGQAIQFIEVPIIVQPNAGIPKLIDGETIFPLTEEEFANYALKFVDLGVNLIGGCCGTTPKHIEKLANSVHGLSPKYKSPKIFTKISSKVSTVIAATDLPTVIIGERINPTARKKLAEEIRLGKTYLVEQEAEQQVNSGANIIDVNVGIPLINQTSTMRKIITILQKNISVPLSIDSNSPEVIKEGLKAYIGKPLINSVTGEEKSLETILPLVKQSGAAVIALTLDDKGIPERAEDKLKIVEKIIKRASELKIPSSDLVFDCLTLPIGTSQQAALETLKSIRLIKKEYGLNTTLGISNISYGLPNRNNINKAFLTMALAAGLTMPIVNPLDTSLVESIRASDAILNKDSNCQRYLLFYSVNNEQSKQANQDNNLNSKQTSLKEQSLKDKCFDAVLKGNKDGLIKLIEEIIRSYNEPFSIVNEALAPAMQKVGQKYEEGVYFLPHLLMAAETLQAGFEVLKKQAPNKDIVSNGKVVLATVEGDIHDLGKNIVAVMLRNSGYTVYDLGKDTSKEKILDFLSNNPVDVVGLSALMTTTMGKMGETISYLRKHGHQTKIIVGGAVVNEEFAKKINADGYGKDAYAAVKLVDRLLNVKRGGTGDEL